jgi:hypothetical protein
MSVEIFKTDPEHTALHRTLVSPSLFLVTPVGLFAVACLAPDAAAV